MSEILDELFDALGKSNVKMVFGIQPDQIEWIEKERIRWQEDKDGLPGFDPIYSDFFWNDAGKKFAWCGLSLALAYFEYTNKKNP